MISFVILHYKNFNDTLECINSIKNLLEKEKISIIVVDNNSLSKNEVSKLNKLVNDIILLNDNLGVAKAYNEGCKLAKEKYASDFICVLNNDIIVNQKDFISVIYKLYDKTKFDVLGPKIICEGDSVNPFPVFDSTQKIELRIKKNEKLIKIYSNKVLANLLEFYLKFKRKIRKPNRLDNGALEEKNVALHGCFMIFPKKYCKRFEKTLPDDTFLFHEEEFLYFRCIQNQLTTLYSPSLEIIHKEGRAMKITNENIINRKKFKLEESNKSLKILLNKLNNNEVL